MRMFCSMTGLKDAAAQQRRRPSQITEIEDPCLSGSHNHPGPCFIVQEQWAEKAPCAPQWDVSTLLVVPHNEFTTHGLANALPQNHGWSLRSFQFSSSIIPVHYDSAFFCSFSNHPCQHTITDRSDCQNKNNNGCIWLFFLWEKEKCPRFVLHMFVFSVLF